MNGFFSYAKKLVRLGALFMLASVFLFVLVFLYHAWFEPYRDRHPEYFAWFPLYDAMEKVTIIEKKEQTTVTENDFVPKLIVNTQNIGVSVVSSGNSGSLQAHGFFVTSDGIVATPLKGIIADANAKYAVFLMNGEKMDATLLGVDSFTETAFLRTGRGNAVTLMPAPEDAFFAGRNVLLIGKSFEGDTPVAHTVSLSEWARSTNMAKQLVGSSEKYEGVGRVLHESLQEESGFAATTYQGELLGMAYTRTAGGESETVILPIRVIMDALGKINEGGASWARPVLGVSYVSVTRELASAYALPADHGAWLSVPGSSASVVLFGSPAYTAGLRQGDVILSINGKEITSDTPLSNQVAEFHPGEKITLGVVRDGSRRDVSVTLGK